MNVHHDPVPSHASAINRAAATIVAGPENSDVAIARKAASQPSNTEATILRVVKDVLGCEAVEPGDNFFEIGGDSLDAIEAADRIEERLGVEVPLPRFLNRSLGDLVRDCAGSR